MLRGFVMTFRLLVMMLVLVACTTAAPTASPTPAPTHTPPSRTFVVRHESISMLPTLHERELLLIEEVPVSELKRGDLIVFQAPERKDLQILKRLIGLPSETVEIRGGKVFINDKMLEEPYLMEPAKGSSPQITIGSDEYYVLGDNRNNSQDSRAFGPVSGKDIRGRVKQ